MTKLCKCFDCIDDMIGMRAQAKFCSDACRHRHWQHVNRASRNKYQRNRRSAPARRLAPYAGQQKDSRHG